MSIISFKFLVLSLAERLTMHFRFQISKECSKFYKVYTLSLSFNFENIIWKFSFSKLHTNWLHFKIDSSSYFSYFFQSNLQFPYDIIFFNQARIDGSWNVFLQNFGNFSILFSISSYLSHHLLLFCQNWISTCWQVSDINQWQSIVFGSVETTLQFTMAKISSFCRNAIIPKENSFLYLWLL